MKLTNCMHIYTQASNLFVSHAIFLHNPGSFTVLKEAKPGGNMKWHWWAICQAFCTFVTLEHDKLTEPTDVYKEAACHDIYRTGRYMTKIRCDESLVVSKIILRGRCFTQGRNKLTITCANAFGRIQSLWCCENLGAGNPVLIAFRTCNWWECNVLQWQLVNDYDQLLTK